MPFTLAELSEAERNRALKRSQQLRPFLEGEMPLTEVVRQEGLALRTAGRWVTRYRQEGPIGLARKPREDKSNRHFSPLLEGIIEGLALKIPRLSIAAVHRRAEVIATEQGGNPTLLQ